VGSDGLTKITAFLTDAQIEALDREAQEKKNRLRKQRKHGKAVESISSIAAPCFVT
jgi:hypothetical protein